MNINQNNPKKRDAKDKPWRRSEDAIFGDANKDITNIEQKSTIEHKFSFAKATYPPDYVIQE
jgi:hypothetical protein